MTANELEKIVISFMDSFTTMTLACSEDDEPWSVPVYYARKELDLIFFSSGKSRHSQIFKKNPKAAASIHGEFNKWQDIKGLQMDGKVEALTTFSAIVRAGNIYFKRYPFAQDFFSKAGILSENFAKKTSVALYLFRPSNLHYLDNSYGFGTRWKLEIQDGRPFGSPVKS